MSRKKAFQMHSRIVHPRYLEGGKNGRHSRTSGSLTLMWKKTVNMWAI